MRKPSATPFIHVPQTVIYAPQYIVNAISPPIFCPAFSSLQSLSPTTFAPTISYAPTLVSFPIATPQGSTQVTTILPHSSWSVPMSTTENAPLLLANTGHAAVGGAPLSAYRFPPPLSPVIDENHCRITELPAEESDENSGLEDGGVLDCDSDYRASDSEISASVDLPTGKADTYRFPRNSPSQRTASSERTATSAAGARAARKQPANRPSHRTSSSTPLVSPSVLLLRKASTCAQPRSPPAHKKMRKAKAGHACGECNLVFSRAHDLKRHQTTHSAIKHFPCKQCSKAFGRKDALKRHMEVRGPYHSDSTRKAIPKARVQPGPSAKSLSTGLKTDTAMTLSIPERKPTSLAAPPAMVVEQSTPEKISAPCKPFKVSEHVPQASTTSCTTSPHAQVLMTTQRQSDAEDCVRKGSLLPPSEGLQLGSLADSDFGAMMLGGIGSGLYPLTPGLES